MLEKPVDTQKMIEFEDQVKLIHDQLYIFLYSIVNDNELAKDALQNTLLSAYNHYDSLKDKAKFKSWIFTIGKREVIRMSTKSRVYVLSEMKDLDINATNSSSEPLVEDLVLKDELKAKIKEAIKSLKKDLKEVIILKYYHDISFEQIASLCDINANTVRTRHMRAKKKINEYLLNHYY